jgi:hypothetical protein
MPILIQTFRDQFGEIESYKALIKNRLNETKLKMKLCSNEIESQHKRIELFFNEIQQFVDEQRNKSLKAFQKEAEISLRKIKEKNKEDDKLLL